MFQKRTWFWILGLTAVLLVAGGLGINYLVGQYLSADGVSSQLSQALNRDVSVNSVDFSVWSGIRLESITISEYPDQSDGTMLEAESLSLQPRWWPLLFGEIKVNQVTLNSPRLQLRRDTDGWNVLEGLPGESESATDSPSETESSEDGVSLAVNQIDLTDVQVHYHDRILDLEHSIRIHHIGLSDVDPSSGGSVSLSDMSLPGARLSSRFEIEVAPFSVKLGESLLTIENTGVFGRFLAEATGVDPGISNGAAQVNVSKGIIDGESVSLSFGMETSNNELKGITESPITLSGLEGEGTITARSGQQSGTMTLSSLSFEDVETTIDRRMNGSGSFKQLKLGFGREDGEFSWTLNGPLERMEVEREGVSDPLVMSDALLEVRNGQYQLSSFVAELGQSTVRGNLSLAGLTSAAPTVDGQIKGEQLRAGLIHELLPPSLLPSGIQFEGTLSAPDLTIRGNLYQPRLNGPLTLRQFKFSTDQLNGPIRVDGQTMNLRGHEAVLEDVAASLSDQSVVLDGTVTYFPSLDLDVTTSIRKLPIQSLATSVKTMQAWPAQWVPSGEMTGSLRVNGSPASPRVTGDLTIPRSSVAGVETINNKLTLNYENESLRLDPVAMELFNGRLNGRVQLTELMDRPAMASKLSLEQLGVERLLTDLAGIGRGSDGRLNSTIQLSTRFESIMAVDGTMNAQGDSIVLKQVPALNNLDTAIINGITDSLGSEFGPMVSQLFGQSLSKQTDELHRLFSEEVTSQFDYVGTTVQFSGGEGEITSGEFRNEFLTILVDGLVWTDGRLKTTVSLKPREALVKRANQQWLKNFLGRDLPPLGVTGTVVQPEYGLNDFRDAVAKSLARSAIRDSGSSGDSEKVEDQLKRKLLEELFD